MARRGPTTANDEGARPEDVISELRRSYDELTLSQKRVAEVIVDDPEFVAFATVDKLAARLGVSPSTIVRFAYRLGLGGYPDLQERVRELLRVQLRGDGGSGGERPQYAEHLAGVHLRSLVNDVENLQRTARALQPEQLDRAVASLAQARRVYVCGGATSQAVAHFMGLALGRVRPDVVLLDSAETSLSPLLDLTADDTLLAFTFPPYARRTLNIVEWAKRAGATVVAVTDTPISPVGQRVDLVVTSTASGIGTQNSLVPAMAVANVLLNGVSGQARAERFEQSVRMSSAWRLFLLDSEDED